MAPETKINALYSWMEIGNELNKLCRLLTMLWTVDQVKCYTISLDPEGKD